jgi:surface protein
MKKFNYQSYGSHAGRMNNGGDKFRRIALFPLMLLMLLLLPTRMVAQTANGNTSNQAYAEFEKSTGTFTFKCGPKPAGAYDLNEGENLPRWYAQRDKIKTVVFDASFANARPTSCYRWFCYCYNLTTIEGIEYLNTENVTNMGGMFYNCCALTSLNLTSFNTAKVTNMEEMFIGCSALTTIYVSDKFVTDKVTDSRNMFSGCNKLIGAIEYDGSKSDHTYANYDNGYFSPEGGFHAYAEFNNATGTLTFSRGLSKPVGAYDLNEGDVQPAWSNQSAKINKVVFDASFANARPTSCYMWFYRCENLTKIEDIENLNTQNVTDMSYMFYRCDGLTSLDVSHFNTQKVEDMSEMFSVCSGLKSLNVSHFDTHNVKDMSYMFYSCERLTSLDVSNFNTQNVTDMSYMFCWCEGLNSLDLSKFDTQNVEYMNYMFWSSSALKTIYVSDKFVTTKVSYGTDMFSGCTSLKGAIDFDDSKTDKTYANYKTGYFTKLVGKNGNDKIGAVGEVLTAESLALADDKDFEAYEPFAAKAASYSRKIKEGTTWGTLCLPFAIDQSKETGCKFYRLTGIDNDNECITLESYEEGIIPAGTPVLFKMNENEQTLSISVQNAGIVKEPVAGTNTDVNLVGSFTKIGGKDNKGLADTDYIIGKDKFWRVYDLNDGKGMGIKPMRAYIHPATASHARAAMLSIGKGDGTTAIDNLNAISNDANAEYYDANGRRTNGLQKGLNIVKRGSKTYKIMVK